MKNMIIVAVLAVAIAGVFVVKSRQKRSKCGPACVATNIVVSAESVTAPLPKLIEFGSDKCHACKKMMPIIDALKDELAGKIRVEFINVAVDREAADAFGIDTIPTQVFFGADGKELYRHIGFFPKEDILDQWHQLGVEL
jgi:thioredoxin 1